MDLRTRLRRLAPSPTPDRSEGGERESLPGRVVETARGSFLRRTERFGLGEKHGGRAFGECLEAPVAPLALLASESGLEADALRRAVFFDIETTSAHGGAGVFVFLIGIGYFDEGAFVLEQYFMRDFGEEKALLSILLDQLDAFDGAVSFFGKAFDKIRLQDRAAALGLAFPFPERFHFDLCHLGRVLWKHRFDSCSLQSLERNILGFRRVDDLPGAECPTTYFDYLKGRPSRIEDVFLHNRFDVLSMVGLTVEIARRAESGTCPFERYGVARTHLRNRAYRKALNGFKSALAAAPPPNLRTRVRRGIAIAAKRLHDYDEAVAQWRHLAEGPTPGVEPFVELAKFHEHKEKRPDKALVYARLAKRTLTRVTMPEDRRKTIHEAIEHRIDRLVRKTSQFVFEF